MHKNRWYKVNAHVAQTNENMSALMHERWAQVVFYPPYDNRVLVLEVMPFSTIPAIITRYHPMILKDVTDETHEYLQERYGGVVENWTRMFGIHGINGKKKKVVK